MQKRRSWIGPMRSEQIDTQNQLGVEVYCSIQPRPLAIDFDSSFVYSDPLRLRLRRVGNAVSDSMYPLKNRLMRALDAERPDGRRRPLPLPTFKICRVQRFPEQFWG